MAEEQHTQQPKNLSWQEEIQHYAKLGEVFASLSDASRSKLIGWVVSTFGVAKTPAVKSVGRPRKAA